MFSQKIEFEKSFFKNIYELKCKGSAALHGFVNETNVFHMIDEEAEFATTYKLNNEFNYNFFVSVFNTPEGGFRINTPNSFLYDLIVTKGEFIEVHKEEKQSFLVYKFGDGKFLISNSIDFKERKHYIIDFWCINN